MKLTVTDRYIENCWNDETQTYTITAETDIILKKNVGNGSNVGRISLPNNLIGLDVLIVESPTIENLY